MAFVSRCRETIAEIASISREPPPQLHPLEEDNNPIIAFFKVFEKFSSAGPGLIWSIHKACKKSDGSPASVFIFDKREADRIFRSKRKEYMFPKMKLAIERLHNATVPTALLIIHELAEGPNTFAFATEPVMASLHHIFEWYESEYDSEPLILTNIKDGAKKKKYVKPPLPPLAVEYIFVELELRYGLLQISNALNWLHYDLRVVHTNVCPQNVIITKNGVWKLFGLEFVKPITTGQQNSYMDYEVYNPKFTWTSQPNLDYAAPETHVAKINLLSDMFSIGMIILALYNNGKSLFDTNDNPATLPKLVEAFPEGLMMMLPKLPLLLQSATKRLLSSDSQTRPPTALFPRTPFFSASGTAIDSELLMLQGLGKLKVMSRLDKIDFLKSLVIKDIDKVPTSLLLQIGFENLKPDLQTPEGLAHSMKFIVFITEHEQDDIFTKRVYPAFRNMYTRAFVSNFPHAVIVFLDALHIFLSKCEEKPDMREEMICVLIWAFENSDKAVLASATHCLMRSMEWIDDDTVLNKALPNIRQVIERHYNEREMSLTCLALFETLVPKLQQNHLNDYIIPTMLIMKLSDATVLERFVTVYTMIVTNERLGIPHDTIATRMLPSVAPHIVNRNMEQSQLTAVMQMLNNMLTLIERDHRIAIEEYRNRPPSPPFELARRQTSIDEPAPDFFIPPLRRRVSSTDAMARRESEAAAAAAAAAAAPSAIVADNIRRLSQWFFGSNNSNNINVGASTSAGAGPSTSGHFLRVVALLPGRRLSDNTLMTPRIRIAPSCSSSPGGTPGGSQAGLPARRHSSIGPQERRLSNANLSPPTAQYGRGRGAGAGSGSSLSVPVSSHPAGGSLPGTSTAQLEPQHGSSASVHSAQSGLAARAALGVRSTGRPLRRPSGCPPSASSGAAAASLQGADFAQCSPSAVRSRSERRRFSVPPSIPEPLRRHTRSLSRTANNAVDVVAARAVATAASAQGAFGELMVAAGRLF